MQCCQIKVNFCCDFTEFWVFATCKRLHFDQSLEIATYFHVLGLQNCILGCKRYFVAHFCPHYSSWPALYRAKQPLLCFRFNLLEYTFEMKTCRSGQVFENLLIELGLLYKTFSVQLLGRCQNTALETTILRWRHLRQNWNVLEMPTTNIQLFRVNICCTFFYAFKT